jgi:hypothetical protein
LEHVSYYTQDELASSCEGDATGKNINLRGGLMETKYIALSPLAVFLPEFLKPSKDGSTTIQINA